jgi:hypothetical protein
MAGLGRAVLAGSSARLRELLEIVQVLETAARVLVDPEISEVDRIGVHVVEMGTDARGAPW